MAWRRCRLDDPIAESNDAPRANPVATRLADAVHEDEACAPLGSTTARAAALYDQGGEIPSPRKALSG